MNSRERIQAAIKHKEPDRVPLDIRGSIVTSIAAAAYEQLIPALDLPPRETAIANLYAQAAKIDEDVAEELDVDTRMVEIHDPATCELELREERGCRTYVDEWNMTHSMPVGGASTFSVNLHKSGSTVRDNRQS